MIHNKPDIIELSEVALSRIRCFRLVFSLAGMIIIHPSIIKPVNDQRRSQATSGQVVATVYRRRPVLSEVETSNNK